MLSFNFVVAKLKHYNKNTNCGGKATNVLQYTSDFTTTKLYCLEVALPAGVRTTFLTIHVTTS